MNKFLISFIFCYSYAVIVLGIFIESSKDLNQCSTYNESTNSKKSISFEVFIILCIFFLIISLFGLPFLYHREYTLWYYTIFISSMASCIFSIFNFLTIFNKIYDINKCSLQIKILNMLLCFFIFISEFIVLAFIIYCIFLSMKKLFLCIALKINNKNLSSLSSLYHRHDNKNSIRNENL